MNPKYLTLGRAMPVYQVGDVKFELSELVMEVAAKSKIDRFVTKARNGRKNFSHADNQFLVKPRKLVCRKGNGNSK